MGTIVVGGVAAVLAAVVLLIYIAQYRNSVRQEQKPVAVLVANGIIPKGTSGDIIGDQQMYSIQSIPANHVQNGAITDPDSPQGRVTVDELFTGTQLTESDFPDKAGISVKLGGTQRSMSIPLDSASGLIGFVQTGDHVDVIGGFNIDNGIDGKTHPFVETLMTNIQVLDAPASSGKSGIGSSNDTSNVVRLVLDLQAADLPRRTVNGEAWANRRATTGTT